MMFDPARLPYTINKFLNWNSSYASTSSLFMHSSQKLDFYAENASGNFLRF